jgi:hypothetical protein
LIRAAGCRILWFTPQGTAMMHPSQSRAPGARHLAHVLISASVAVAAGCAAAPPSPLSGGDSQTSVSVQSTLGTSEHTIRREDFVAMATLPAPRQAVWQHLLEAWRETGLPEPDADARAFTLTIVDRPLMRRLGTTPLSTYLDCGNSITGWNADTHRVHLTMRTLLERVAADSTRVHSRVDAVAHSTAGASAGPIACTSKGTLESQLAQRVRQKLDRQQP